MCVSACVHQVPACSGSSLALMCLLHHRGFGSAVAEDGSRVVVARVRMESSAFYAGCACSACAVAWPVGAVYVGGGGAGEAVRSADAADVVLVGAGLVAGWTVVRSSLSARHHSGLAETDRKDMVVISGPSEAYLYLVEHPGQEEVRKSSHHLDILIIQYKCQIW